jgi:hypothetical protein
MITVRPSATRPSISLRDRILSVRRTEEPVEHVAAAIAASLNGLLNSKGSSRPSLLASNALESVNGGLLTMPPVELRL